MERIKDTIFNVIKDLDAKKNTCAQDEPEESFKKLLTKKELLHIKINQFRDGTLYVSVDSSAWLYMLSMRKEELLSKARARSSKIKNLHFRIGEITL